ncbi:hypothetical protein U6A24_18245 [Aquimarina gracilis]|uniref:Uncharacterized protein n=1 Tax=Aquimarina gracilis TaxID=874422 RepID=A0ABU6A010_9FLAO|nr:hypothetical protein [Aquimarina gracilis]MEB3347422.1 hypothetical protein [Aquimarina gracilis]
MENKPKRQNYDFGKLFIATKSFIDTYNQNKQDIKERLNANHRATAELITRLYAKQLNKAIQLGDTFENGTPGFRTYNPSLASCKGCTVRTIMNHKERLKAAGFIIKEVHHGKSGIELWINTEIFSERVKNLHPLVHVQQEQINNNRNVDMLITSEEGVRPQAHQQKDNYVTGTMQEQDMNTEESRISDSKSQTRCEKNLSTGESESAFLLHLVKDFWKYSKAVLYSDILLSEPEENDILNQIWASVYRKFKIKGSKKDWKSYQQILYKRVDMVSRWLERNPNRWIPPAHLYFHPENKKNGFNRTYEWFIKQETLKRNIRNQILIQKTEAEWLAHHKGEGKHKHKSRLQLFSLQRKRLVSYGDETLINAYEQSLQRTLIKLSTQ